MNTHLGKRAKSCLVERCFKNVRHDECLGRTVEGTTGRLDSSLPLLARAQGHSCGRSVGQERSPSEETHHVPCWDVWRCVGYTGILLHDWRQKTGSEALWASWAFVFLCLVPQWSACTLSLQGELEWGKPTSVPLLAELGGPGYLAAFLGGVVIPENEPLSTLLAYSHW